MLAPGSNADSLTYELEVEPIPSPPHTWSGTAKADGGHSTAQLALPTSDTYHVMLDTPVGFAQVLIDGTTLSVGTENAIESHSTELYVPLSAGPHDFAVVQSTAYPTTMWTMSVSPTTVTGIIAEFTGDLEAGEQVDPQIPVFDPDLDVNFWIEVPPVAGGGQLGLEIIDGDGSTVFDGTALDGETLWGTAVLQPGQNTFTLHNSGLNPISYHVIVYQIEATPFAWGGQSRAAGTWDSHIKLDFPQDGLYTFDFEPSGGRYQFLVDENYVQKTAEVSGSVTYYVAAGDHVLKITPDRTSDMSWTLATSDPGAVGDTLPYTKAGGDLGGTGNDFSEEWLPLKLDIPANANFQLTLSGADTDSMDVLLYAPDDSLLSPITNVFGGETLWWTTDLPATVSRIQLLANPANSGPLTYSLSAHQMPTISNPAPTTWSGTSYGPANNSQLRFEVPADSLLDFSFNAPQGRFQFLVDANPHIQKTVENSGTVRFFLPAGTHLLTIAQDPLTNDTSWSLGIAATGLPFDSLPLSHSGGNLGGTDNPFLEEWLPLFLEEGQQANFRLHLNGSLDDGLQASLYHNGSTTPAYTSPPIYGQETFWWTANLAAGLNYVQLLAPGSNADSLTYELEVEPIHTVAYGQPFSWDGLSKDQGANSEIVVQTPVSATYQVIVDIPVGFANVFITGTNTLDGARPEQAHYEFFVPLEEGKYSFQVWQSSAYITTTWAVTVGMWAAPMPEITAIAPVSMTNNVSHELTIWGAYFQPEAAVQLDGIDLSPIVRQDSTMLQTWVPAGLPTGVYSLTVTNPDGQSATLTNALQITKPIYHIYLPIVSLGRP